MFESVVMSCSQRSYKSKDTGEDKTFWLIYIADTEGNVGGVFSQKPYKPGEKVKIALALNRDGRFGVRIAE